MSKVTQNVFKELLKLNRSELEKLSYDYHKDMMATASGRNMYGVGKKVAAGSMKVAGLASSGVNTLATGSLVGVGTGNSSSSIIKSCHPTLRPMAYSIKCWIIR